MKCIFLLITVLFALGVSHWPANGQESASIRASATVVNPVGFSDISTKGQAGLVLNEYNLFLPNQKPEKIKISTGFGLGGRESNFETIALNLIPENRVIDLPENWLIQKTISTDSNPHSITFTLVSTGN